MSPLVIVIVAFLLRLVELFVFEGSVLDGTGRVMDARDWLLHDKPIFGHTLWPDGNYLLPALALLIWDDMYWSVRILYAFVGVTNVWLVYLLGKAVYDRKAGAVAGWIVAFLPYHILVSSESAMSEGPYVSFILLALLAIVKYSAKPNPWLAAAAGVSLTLATLFRIDGVVWGIPLAISIALVALNRRTAPSHGLRDLLIFGVCGLLYPSALFVKWAMLYPDPFYIFAQGKNNTLQFFVNGKHPRWSNWIYQSYVVAFWPFSTFVLLTPLVAALGWVGVFTAVRERRQSTTPLVIGLLTICVWLSYAAFSHSILAQWRYALVLIVLLTVFCLPGAQAIAHLFRTLTLRRITFAVAIVALIWQGFITYVAFVDCGTLTRQIGMLSLIRPNQFEQQALLAWIRSMPTSSSGDSVLFTAHASGSPYFTLHRTELEQTGRIVVQSSYLPNSVLMHTSLSLISELEQKMSNANVRFVVTSTSQHELGLRDGLTREVVEPMQASDGKYMWHGIKFRLVQRFGSTLLWEVVRP